MSWRPLPVRLVRRAAGEIREASRWWDENRPAAPGAVDEAIQEALVLIQLNPRIGGTASNVALPGVRGVHLSRIHYYLYFPVRQEPHEER